METRPFGRTGERMPILSLGCQRLVDEAIPLGEITVSSPPDARQVDSTPQSR